jgi:hypothetical protein
MAETETNKKSELIKFMQNYANLWKFIQIYANN